jgi:methylmalonyl-CoA mutase
VIDPAGGSTYIEWLTDQIAAKSWNIFQEIERQGGMSACLEDGSVQEAVTAVCNAKLQNVRRRKDKIIGCNMYPNLKGRKLEMVTPECKARQGVTVALPSDLVAVTDSAGASMIEQAIVAAKNGATKISLAFASGLMNMDDALSVTPLYGHRAAEEYEALRDASIAFTLKTGAAPAILQLNMGPSGRYRLRADWTASFFEAAGFAVDGVRDFLNADDAVKALESSNAIIAVITSDDATYTDVVASLAVAVKSARPSVTLLVAGTPGDHEVAWRTAGVDEFVNVRSNNFELNQQLLKRAGVL